MTMLIWGKEQTKACSPAQKWRLYKSWEYVRQYACYSRHSTNFTYHQVQAEPHESSPNSTIPIFDFHSPFHFPSLFRISSILSNFFFFPCFRLPALFCERILKDFLRIINRTKKRWRMKVLKGEKGKAARREKSWRRWASVKGPQLGGNGNVF